MELTILDKKKNPLFGREEVSAKCVAEITPSKHALQEALGAKLSVPAEQITIVTVKSKFGEKIFMIRAFGYSDAEEKKRLEYRPEKKKKEKKKSKK